MREQTIGTGISAAMALVLVITGCAGDDDDTAGGAAAAAATTTTSPVEVVGTAPTAETGSTVRTEETVAVSTTAAEITGTSPAAATTVADGRWREDAAAWCADGAAAYAARPSLETAGVAAVVAAVRADRDDSFEAIAFPDELRRAPSDVLAIHAQQEQLLNEAEAAVAAGDVDSAIDLIDHFDTLLAHNAALLTVAGVECVGDPARAANASLNVPVPNVWQVETGFGSVWASQDFATTIVRVDAVTGEILASIDVGALAIKPNRQTGG